jgi:hypothetical protein
MTDAKDDGGPAFPYPSTEFHAGHAGMTLRDWFAGQALAGLAPCFEEYGDVAGHAYRLADAMLEARL